MGSSVFESGLKEVEKAIAERVEVMVFNDMHQSVSLGPDSELHIALATSAYASVGVGLVTAAVEMGGALAVCAAASAFAASAAIGAGVFWAVCSTKVDSAYVTERFHKMYDQRVGQARRIALEEFNALCEQMSCKLKVLENSLAAFREADLQLLVQQGFREVLEQLRLEYAELMQLNSQ